MKTKLTDMLRGKEKRKDRKNRYAKLSRGRWRFVYIEDQLQGEKNSRKNKEKNKCRKNMIGLKKLKIKIIKKRKGKKGRRKKNKQTKKENSTELQKPNI